MTDTHSHPYLEEFSDGGADAVRRAVAAGVRHIVLPNVDASSVGPMLALHERFPGVTSVALGLHPTEVGDGWETVVDDMEEKLSAGGFVAVGEVGIDLYWDKSRRGLQLDAFRRQLAIADRLCLPVIIHCREGLDETLQCISEVNPSVRLVFHSFTEGPDEVKRIRAVCDPMFGINGVVTFRNASALREAVPEIGLDRLLLETDAPYLAPVPYRGKRNEPVYIFATCAKVAEVMGLPPDEIERTTDANAASVFSLSDRLSGGDSSYCR